MLSLTKFVHKIQNIFLKKQLYFKKLQKLNVSDTSVKRLSYLTLILHFFAYKVLI